MDNLFDALKAVEKLSKKDMHYIVMQLLYQEKIDIPLLISSYSQYLTDFKHDAIEDIRKLSDAGVMLGEKGIKNIPKIKNESKRHLHTALANTLLDVGYRGTDFNSELRKYVDMAEIDSDWYERFWKLNTPIGRNTDAE